MESISKLSYSDEIKCKQFRMFYGEGVRSGSSKGWNFCKLRTSSGDSKLL